jgi:hypothetical protein
MRCKRNNLLFESDWTQLPDVPIDPEPWAVYRQALRDFPNEHTVTNKAEYDALVWPTPPEP